MKRSDSPRRPDQRLAAQNRVPAPKRDRQATTEVLKAAAIKVFAAKGYDAATTREVAQAAGVNEQLIQRYFGGKSGMLLAIMRTYADSDRAGRFGAPAPAESLEAEIAGFLRFHLERERRFGDFARVAIYRSIVDADIAAAVGRMFTESREPALLARLFALRASGLIDPHADLRSAAHALSTLSFALAFNDQLIFRRSAPLLGRTVRGFARTIAKGLAAGHEPGRRRHGGQRRDHRRNPP
jgi:AcrR family transcriptional regulator